MASKLPTHVFSWDGITDPRALKPVRFCTCCLPEHHEVHTLPAQDPDVRALQDRILGEHPTESENAE